MATDSDLMQVSDAFTLLPSTPVAFMSQCSIPKPLFYEKNVILVTTNFDDHNPGIYKFNFETNQLELLSSYNNISPKSHGQFIDYDHNVLYLYGGKLSDIYQFDLNTNTFKELSVTWRSLQSRWSFPVAVNVSNRNETHILGRTLHFKFHHKTQSPKITKVSPYALPFDGRNRKALYIPLEQQVMVLGGDMSDEIWTCSVGGKPYQMHYTMYNYDWTLRKKLRMPHCVSINAYDVMLIGDVVFVFYFNGTDQEHNVINDIWFLCLLKEKWYKSEVRIPIWLCDEVFVIRTKNNDIIHLLGFMNQEHLTVKVDDLLTQDFINDRRIYYNSLIMGYFREKEKDTSFVNMPFVLKQLILNYFPLIDNN